jgi:hypothetical protein
MQVQQNKEKWQNVRFIHRGSETPVRDCYKAKGFAVSRQILQMDWVV